MFFKQNRNNRRTQKRSFASRAVDISTIIGAAITCIELAYKNIVSISVAALIMVGVVIFVALGTNLAKIVLAATALILFALLYSGGDREQFKILMTQVGAVILALMGIYIIIKGFFRR